VPHPKRRSGCATAFLSIVQYLVSLVRNDIFCIQALVLISGFGIGIFSQNANHQQLSSTLYSNVVLSLYSGSVITARHLANEIE